MKKTILAMWLLLVLLLMSGCACKHEQTNLSGVKDPTCMEEGYTGDAICVKCSETVTTGEAIPAAGHTNGETANVKEATCTQVGYTGDVMCAVCSGIAVPGEEIPAKGHTPASERVNVQQSTCVKEGYTGDVICEVCGETLETGLASEKSGHVELKIWAKEATCDDDGYSGDVFCDLCDAEIRRGEVIPAFGHAMPNAVGAKDATCYARGSWGEGDCVRCGEHIKNRGKDRLPHSFENDVCTVCGWHTAGLWQDGTLVYTWQELIDRGDLVEDDDKWQVANAEMTGTLVVEEDELLDENMKAYGVAEISLTGLYLPSTGNSIPELNRIDSITELKLFGGDRKYLYEYSLKGANVREVVVPEGVTEIGWGCFSESSVERVVLPSTITSMEKYTFNSCENLTEVVMQEPFGLAVLPDGMFYGCTSLKMLTIPEGVEGANSGAFTLCSSLETLVLPKSLTDLSGFMWINSLKTIYYRGTQEEWDVLDARTNLSKTLDVICDYTGD